MCKGQEMCPKLYSHRWEPQLLQWQKSSWPLSREAWGGGQGSLQGQETVAVGTDGQGSTTQGSHWEGLGYGFLAAGEGRKRQEAGRLRRELGRLGRGPATCRKDGGRLGRVRKEEVGWTSGQGWGPRPSRKGESSVAWIWDLGFLAALVVTPMGALGLEVNP